MQGGDLIWLLAGIGIGIGIAMLVLGLVALNDARALRRRRTLATMAAPASVPAPTRVPAATLIDPTVPPPAPTPQDPASITLAVPDEATLPEPAPRALPDPQVIPLADPAPTPPLRPRRKVVAAAAEPAKKSVPAPAELLARPLSPEAEAAKKQAESLSVEQLLADILGPEKPADQSDKPPAAK